MIDNSSTSPAPMVPAQTLLETARAYWEAGLTPMPRLPGEVNPHYLTDDGDVRAIGWGSYKQKQPAWSTVERWFRLGSLATVGVTLLTGSHEMPRSADAACLQILDIETAELFEAFMKEVRFLGHEEILNRCTIERTASAGGHLGFLCATISDKQKLPLARRADHKILIELLQHQPCTVAPTQIRCKETHAEGAAYTLMHGTWAHPQVLSPAQRQIIIDVARRYTEVPEKVAAEPGEHTTGTRPGDVLGERADIAWWQDLLTRHDWHDVSRPGWARSGVYYFRRPGKVGHAVSATYGRTGPTLYVFSSNAFPFEAETAYIATLLEHGGDYQAAARALAQLYGLDQRRNGQGPGPEPTDAHACPALPAYAQTNEASAAQASLFLDDYIQISTQWAPRAYEGFHEAVALFLLSTLAARRIKILFGSRGTYTSLYIAMAARTTIYTKSTTANIGLALLDAAGLSWLLADDDSTPQAFLRSLSLYVPSNYAQLPPEEQDLTRHQLAFAGQRGWFYEEWGGHLEAMMQKNGYMAGFRSILRRLDDHKVRYASSTIARGREILHKPYVSLLANVTPSDLQPFVKARSPLWRDGYIARFAFVTPDQGEGSAAEFPEGSLTFPGYLVTTAPSTGISA